MTIRIGIDVGSDTIKMVVMRDGDSVEEMPILRVQAQPLRRVREGLEEIRKRLFSHGPCGEAVLLGFTGSGGAAMAQLLGGDAIDEPVALAASVSLFYPEVRTIVEMGREGHKYLLFERDEASGRLVMADCHLGDKCAAGGGAFLDHMATRLNFGSIEEFARVALETERPAALSGRCSVFTESDIVHLYQKGTSRERIAAGIHQAICRNYRARFARGKGFPPRVAFIGGVSENPAAVKYLQKELNLDGNLFVPRYNRTLGAIGAALRASRPVVLEEALSQLEAQADRPISYEGSSPLRFESSEILTPRPSGDIPTEIALAALGVDIGSVSTKAALITEVDGQLHVLASYYRKTDGDPLAAVRDTIGRIYREVQEKGYCIHQVVAATTGSGRYLTGDYIGADLIRNEITAQANGALAFMKDIDTIFEIGGQDSKYIRLDGDVVIDFEMNRACAAGCGAFLEKQAARLGIPVAEFGERALHGTNPPHIDWTCTVFTESAMLYFQQAGVAIEDLCAAVCLASVKNYLSKNIGGRDIGKRIAFQGAVAFNKGMVAAFETVLGLKIIVPPYPHLTGAIGAARLALQSHPEQPHFRGFEKIAEGRYEVGSFECKGCSNACDVNTFQMEGGPKYYYNDRCERYSSVLKKHRDPDLPDLFAEREQMLFEVYPKKAPAGSPRIGIPRGLMFAEYFPLYNAFLTELGFEVVASDRSSKEVVRQGLAASLGEPCFPFKVAHGHYLNLLEKGVDFIFAPGVIATEQPDPGHKKSLTCPYLQAAPDLLATCTGVYERNVAYIAPRLHFNRGKRHLVRVFTEVARMLGKSAAEARRALDIGLKVLTRFRRWQEERGREILESLAPDSVAFVVVGRPYTLYDEAVNCHIAKKIRDLGIPAIPQDFLPLAQTPISDSWPKVSSRQIQRKLSAARIIREDLRLRAVVLTYFGCGPDSFANPFFRDEIDEPCYVMQLDEHTADAGVITRLEAFADTVTAGKKPGLHPTIRTTVKSLGQVRGRKVWLPYASEGVRVIAAVLRAYGIDADVLPRSPDPAMHRARSVISEDVCLPALMTTEDILYRTEQPDFDPQREAFFQGTSDGPCRYSMYHILQRRILDKLGLKTVDIATLGADNKDGGLGTHFILAVWDGLVAHDLVQRMLHRTRPYELQPGESDALYAYFVRAICDMMPEHRQRLQEGFNRIRSLLGKRHLEPLEDLLHRAQDVFARVPRRDEPRPLVGVVGEFYVRIHDGANQDVIRRIERNGGEVWLAPVTEFFAYSNRIGMRFAFERWWDTLNRGHLLDFLTGWLNHRFAIRDEHALSHSVRRMLSDYPDIGPDEVIEKGSHFVHRDFGGEAICSLGKASDFAERGLAGVVAVRPFNCMPGNIVAAFSHELRRRHDNIPFLNLDYDGFVDSSRDMKIANFMWQVKERWGSLPACRR